MPDTARHFTAGPDEFGRTWKVDFRWQQTATSIRHADTVDVKYRLETDDRTEEKVVALPHVDLLAVAGKLGRPLTDAWVMQLASAHLRHMILTSEDMEKSLVTLSRLDIERHADLLRQPAAAR